MCLCLSELSYFSIWISFQHFILCTCNVVTYLQEFFWKWKFLPGLLLLGRCYPFCQQQPLSSLSQKVRLHRVQPAAIWSFHCWHGQHSHAQPSLLELHYAKFKLCFWQYHSYFFAMFSFSLSSAVFQSSIFVKYCADLSQTGGKTTRSFVVCLWTQ